MIVEEGIHTCDHPDVVALCQRCLRQDCSGDCAERKETAKAIMDQRRLELKREREKKRSRKKHD